MLCFVWWQDDSSAESDDDDEEVSQRLQAKFVSFIDFFFVFFFQLYFTNGQDFRLLSLKDNAQLSFFEFLIIDGLATFYHSKKTGAKTRPSGIQRI